MDCKLVIPTTTHIKSNSSNLNIQLICRFIQFQSTHSGIRRPDQLVRVVLTLLLVILNSKRENAATSYILLVILIPVMSWLILIRLELLILMVLVMSRFILVWSRYCAWIERWSAAGYRRRNKKVLSPVTSPWYKSSALKSRFLRKRCKS